ncbi:MAG: hypothetical protein U1F77_09505 [Kiritimatiellia bacterium]
MSGAYNLLGMARYRLKDAAQTAFRRKAAWNNAHAPAAYNLGILHAERERMPEAARSSMTPSPSPAATPVP